LKIELKKKKKVLQDKKKQFYKTDSGSHSN
jgi:hypothetical protein